MTLYLQMDGVDDRITLPSMTFTEIVMDFKVTSKASFERYWSLPFGAEYFQVASGNINDQWSAGVSMVYWNGAAQTNVTAFIPVGTRGVARSEFSTAKTNSIYIFSNNTSNIAHGDIWDIKIYNGATLQAHYDMSTGTIQDQSGNGRHATLTGGTWLDDGVGGGTNVTVTSITANTTASSLVPTVSAQQQVSVSSVVANATINALNPQVGVFTNVVVNALIANVTASANVPNVGTVRNINIAHIIPNMLATAIIPTIRIVEPVIFRVGIPVTSILEKELVLRSELENTMPVSTNIISTITINPTV